MDSDMMSVPKVSIMVVAYNAESYISECLDSLCVQTFHDFEVICVNDGSTDSTRSVIERYVAKDCRFRLFDLSTNRGISVARNKALSECRGVYHAELDSDDWFDPNTLELAVAAMESAEECDLVMFDVVCFTQSTGEKRVYESRSGAHLLSGRDAFERSLDWSIHGYYMVRSTITQGIRYDETNSVSDENTCRLLFVRSRRVLQCSGRYYYRQHSESIMQKCTIKQFDMLEAHLAFRPIVLSLNEERLVSLFDDFRWTMFTSKWYYYWSNQFLFSKCEQKQIEGRLRKVYQSFKYERLSRRFCKFGFYSFDGCYPLFWVSSRSYFWMKRIFNKI